MSDNDEYQPDSLPIEVQEPEQQGWDGVSEPKPHMFDNYDQYVGSLADFKAKKALADFERDRNKAASYRLSPNNPNLDPGVAMAEAVRQGLEADRAEQAAAQVRAQQQLTPWPDDLKEGERAEWTKLSMDAGKEAIKAKEAGDIKKYHDWRQRQKQYEGEIEKLGPTPQQKYAEAVEEYNLEVAMKNVTNPDYADSPLWQHPRWQNDAPVEIVKANAKARTTIRLPLEISQFGNLLSCEPKNMATIELDADQMARFKNEVGTLSAKEKEDPDAVLRKSWRVLHSLGYSAGAKPVMESKHRKAEDPETTENPEAMSWRRFCEWRQEQEDRRRGGPRKPFAHPKPR